METLGDKYKPVNFTYPEEEAMWWNDHPSKSQKEDKSHTIENNPQFHFEYLRDKTEKEIQQYRNFLDGKILLDNGKPMTQDIYSTWYNNRIFYIEFPEDFYAYANLIYGKLDDVSKAWLDNTRELIKKYHEIFIAEQKKMGVTA